MRRKWLGPGLSMISRNQVLITLLILGAVTNSDGARRITKRKDTSRSVEEVNAPTPSAETLAALAQATGATEFEHYTEGKALVKRLIPNSSQPDLDVVEHQGVIGKAGVDFPAFLRIPNTGFSCRNVPTGYYADLETDCQVFHICDTSRKISFLCPNGTIFSQSHLICDWWFKVDCASSPALYESSAEYYSNEQKKTKKISHPITKNNLQQIGLESNIRAESRRASVNIPSTTERLLRHRQRLQNDQSSSGTVGATANSYQALFADASPTQRSTTAALEKRRKNLVQLINGFTVPQSKTTLPTYTVPTTYKPTIPVDYNNVREMQIAAESASFTNNNNRQFLQDYNKNYRLYPVYTPNFTSKPNKAKSNPNLTTLYDIRDKQSPETQELSSKRPTLQTYTKNYSPFIEKQEPYTRPGISSLKEYLGKEKNKTLTTENTIVSSTQRNDRDVNIDNIVTIESKSSFESATKIPQIKTTKDDTTHYSETASSDRYDVYSSTKNFVDITPEPTYQERRERLLKKINSESLGTTLPTIPTEKYYGDRANRPGLIIPPSLAPKSLHTLAIYYATALDNFSTTVSPETEATHAIDDYDDGIPSLLSSDTINKYSSLFGQGMSRAELLEEIRNDPNGTYNELMEDLSVMQSQNPIATSPQIRELAQVFTHALSAYLQDPVQFRKVLSDIRPTHPSFTETTFTTEEPSSTEPTTTLNEDDDEILGFSDDNRHLLNSLRNSKALKLSTEYTTVSEEIITTPKPVTSEITTYPPTTTFRSLFRCCGKISASYTTASADSSTTLLPFTNTVVNINTPSSTNVPSETTTENSYAALKFGGFQNNNQLTNSPYGHEIIANGKPLSEYVEPTNLPTAWGVDITTSSETASTSSPVETFESKKIKTVPTTTAVYFTETDSLEIENEEELQRAHSQSFAKPQQNSLRHGKELILNVTNDIKKPSENLEAPTPNVYTTTIRTSQPTINGKYDDQTTTVKESETTSTRSYSSIFTSPDADKSTIQFQWPTTFESWHSTVVLDPILLNEGLTSTGLDAYSPSSVGSTYITNTATPSTPYTTTESALASTINIEITTPGGIPENRFGRLIKEPSSTEAGRDLTTIADTVVQKAKEMMGGMNSTTTEKLMNVMKKTKSKSVKRLILLLVQTCDDDHNSTAEASKKALLDALMAVSQKDMEEIEKEEGTSSTTVSPTEIASTISRRNDGNIELSNVGRRGKSLDFDVSVINSLSNPSTTEGVSTSDVTEATTIPVATTHRGTKKFLDKTTTAARTTQVSLVDAPRAEARVSEKQKAVSDTRALELLRSLYTIASRWG